MNNLLICFCLFILCATTCKADVEVYPANYDDTHYIGKCDSNAVKKRAHKWGFMSYQKSKDVEMQSKCYETCKILATTKPEMAVSCNNDCNNQQREQRKDGFTAGQGLINLLGIGAALLK